MKFLQTKPQAKNMNINYDLSYTVIKNRVENKDIDYNDHINFIDFFTPNHYVGIKPRETILREAGKIEILNESFKVILTI